MLVKSFRFCFVPSRRKKNGYAHKSGTNLRVTITGARGVWISVATGSGDRNDSPELAFRFLWGWVMRGKPTDNKLSPTSTLLPVTWTPSLLLMTWVESKHSENIKRANVHP